MPQEDVGRRFDDQRVGTGSERVVHDRKRQRPVRLPARVPQRRAAAFQTRRGGGQLQHVVHAARQDGHHVRRPRNDGQTGGRRWRSDRSGARRTLRFRPVATGIGGQEEVGAQVQQGERLRHAKSHPQFEYQRCVFEKHQKSISFHSGEWREFDSNKSNIFRYDSHLFLLLVETLVQWRLGDSEEEAAFEIGCSSVGRSVLFIVGDVAHAVLELHADGLRRVAADDTVERTTTTNYPVVAFAVVVVRSRFHPPSGLFETHDPRCASDGRSRPAGADVVSG